ncbi:lytic transglycosylase domain-containing protein [Microbacterium flavum]|uniref:aggregation-promoting factor C-terminal-like domain-containing protein n=1 Tax=Microbacterium flavum TaxID=415216 RepID=UPI0024ADBB33|nr:lytic transglycosylase domain-containing protein [Microbacterium flavum]
MTPDDLETRARTRELSTRAAATPRQSPPTRWSRRRGVVAVFAALAVAGLGAAYVGPLGAAAPRAEAAQLDPVSLYATTIADAQSLVAASRADGSLGRETITYSVYMTPKPTPTPSASASASAGSDSGEAAAEWSPPFVSPDPGTAQAIAYVMVQERGWGDGEFACLVALWNKESGWRVNAYNAGSGAYGIPQSLPGNKMASAGGDWETNPATQIAWGLGYIGGRYGSPCGAWGHSQSSGWY